jgi:ribosome-associated protein
VTVDVVASNAPAAGPEQVAVDFPITLGQFLKTAGLAGTGGEAKQMIATGLVRVNGVVDTRRGHKLAAGDVVSAAGEEARAVAADATGRLEGSEPPGR